MTSISLVLMYISFTTRCGILLILSSTKNVADASKAQRRVKNTYVADVSLDLWANNRQGGSLALLRQVGEVNNPETFLNLPLLSRRSLVTFKTWDLTYLLSGFTTNECFLVLNLSKNSSLHRVSKKLCYFVREKK